MYIVQLPEWKTKCKLIQDINELPNWFNNEYLYLDFETTSGDDKETSLNPWRNCKILGIAIVVDDEEEPLYIPLRHRNKTTFTNLDIDQISNWLRLVLSGSKFWVNHNIKYDAHVLLNEGVDFRDTTKLIDTLMLCRMAPRLEELTYNLTDVMNRWCYTQIQHHEDKIKLYLKQYKSKDYAVVPIDIMCPYACVDVLSVRKLYKQLCKEIPTECHRVTNLEKEVTGVLFDIERNGMRVNTDLLEVHETLLQTRMQILELEVTLLAGIPGWQLHTNSFGKAFFVDKEGLAPLSWTEKGHEASFDNDTLLKYKALYPKYAKIVDKVIAYRELKKLFTSFTVPYINLNIDGIIHPSYNQIVRTGRMSCRTPNMQQLSPEAREYIIPYDNNSVIVDIDYSQIEFRLIAHFIQSEPIIKAYNEDEKADYHTIVANLCGIDRKPAKTMNFMLGYGGGRKKCVETLSSIPEVIGELKDKHAIELKAGHIYTKYHEMVPTLKATQYRAMSVCKARGFVRTIMGRRRYLPPVAYFAAFNTVSQGSAADIYKAALVRLDRYLKDRGGDTKIIGCVHDSFVLNMPKSLEKIRLRLLNEVPFPREFIEALLSTNEVDLQFIQDTIGWPMDTARNLLSFLNRQRALKRQGRSYVKTMAFTQLLKEMEEDLDGKNEEGRPSYIPEEF